MQKARPQGKNSEKNSDGIQENRTKRIDLLKGGKAVTLTKTDRV